MKKLTRAALSMVILVTISTMLTGCDAGQIGQIGDQIIQVVVGVIQSVRGAGGGAGGNAGGGAGAPVNPPAAPNPPADTNPPAAPTPPAADTAGTGGAQACVVTVYTSNNCPFCDQAKDYLKKAGVAFVEKNVGLDEAAKTEMENKARAAGLPVAGVPKIDVCGTMLHGFDAAKLGKTLKDKVSQTPAPTPPANNTPIPNPANDGGPAMRIDNTLEATPGD